VAGQERFQVTKNGEEIMNEKAKTKKKKNGVQEKGK
jgi:hypothetical protein